MTTFLSIGSAEKRCLQTEYFCDVMEILQSHTATATSRPPTRDILDTANPPRDFDQSVMLTNYRWPLLLTWFNFNPDMDK